MKVLLLGEHSGVHNNLKKGLTQLGINVVMINDGDDFKNFSKDFSITYFKNGFLSPLKNVLYFIKNYKRFVGYDVVQFISPFVFPWYYSILGVHIFLKVFNEKIIYYACGTDPSFIKIKDKLKYFPIDDEKSFYKISYNNVLLKFAQIDKLRSLIVQLQYFTFLKKVDCIVPAYYSMGLAYSKHPKVKEVIPLPSDGIYVNQEIKPYHNCKILFGITRRSFKGADYILDAINKLKDDGNKNYTIRIIEKLPIQEYENILLECDILIDQCKSYSYGMNAILAMSRGKVVLSGAEKVAISYLGIADNSVFNIIPDPIQIYSTLKMLITSNPDRISKIKQKNILQVLKYHDPKIIAKKFITIYK